METILNICCNKWQINCTSKCIFVCKIFLTTKTSKCDFSKNIYLNEKKKESCTENQKIFKIIYHLILPYCHLKFLKGLLSLRRRWNNFVAFNVLKSVPFENKIDVFWYFSQKIINHEINEWKVLNQHLVYFHNIINIIFIRNNIFSLFLQVINFLHYCDICVHFKQSLASNWNEFYMNRKRRTKYYIGFYSNVF